MRVADGDAERAEQQYERKPGPLSANDRRWLEAAVIHVGMLSHSQPQATGIAGCIKGSRRGEEADNGLRLPHESACSNWRLRGEADFFNELLGRELAFTAGLARSWRHASAREKPFLAGTAPYPATVRVVKVPLGNRSYQIQIGVGLLGRLGAECARLALGRRCAIITDTNVNRHFARTAIQSLRRARFDPTLIILPAGETAKRLALVQRCYDQLAAHRLERKSFIVALGGGVVGDLAGFVAATYLRGIPFVQVPTTLLAQVDSSVGGKVGVNLPAGKNLVGAFHQPRLVLCDLATLRLLPEREFRAGLAEVIKYGIIYDAKFFVRLERSMPAILRRSPAALAPTIARCCEIKAAVVGQDETESGLRAILNFGHTIGHGLEAISSYGKYLHGEAIAIGQVAAAKLSQFRTGLRAAEVERIESLFARVGLPTEVKLSPAQRRKLFNAMRLDKKVSGGDIKFVLAKRIGKVVWGQSVPPEVITQALNSPP
jgi:3-dehydroquinate synthase